MLVVVNQPPIDFQIKGAFIPKNIIDTVKRQYGEDCVSVEEESDYINIDDLDWYKQAKAEETPGGNLRTYRQMQKMTQSELAEKLGIVKQNVSNMENGKRTISKDMAKKLAKIFRTSPARFI